MQPSIRISTAFSKAQRNKDQSTNELVVASQTTKPMHMGTSSSVSLRFQCERGWVSLWVASGGFEPIIIQTSQRRNSLSP